MTDADAIAKAAYDAGFADGERQGRAEGRSEGILIATGKLRSATVQAFHRLEQQAAGIYPLEVERAPAANDGSGIKNAGGGGGPEWR